MKRRAKSASVDAMPRPPKDDLIERLRDELDEMTESERLIATYMISERHDLPFETAASLAHKLQVSAVTVGRFCRRMGYQNFRALKEDLRSDAAALPWYAGDIEALAKGKAPDRDLKKDLDANLAGVTEVYRMAATPEWARIVQLLANASELIVAGFQTERGLAMHFAHLLQYVRPDVRIADLSAGNFADVLASDRPGRCLVIVETRRYSRHAQLLAEQAKEQGIAIVFITDKYCHWARKVTPHVLALATEGGMFWTTMVPLVAALTLLANGVVLAIGAKAEPRLERVSDLYQTFTGHVGQKKRQPGARRPPSRKG